MNTARLFMWAILTCLSGLFVAHLSGCNAHAGPVPPAKPFNAPWTVAMHACKVSADERAVTCPIPEMREIMRGSIAAWENWQLCKIELEEAQALCDVDKREIMGQVEELQDELGAWYRNPWIMAGIGVIGGLAIGLGVGFGR